MNNKTTFLAYVQGTMTEMLRYEPNAMPHEIGVLLEKINPVQNRIVQPYPTVAQQKKQAA